MTITHVYRDTKIKSLTLASILTDKPDRIYWINCNVYTPVIVTIVKGKHRDHSITFSHSGAYSKPGEDRIEELIDKYLEKRVPTFSSGKAYLIANNAYADEDRKVFVDFFSDTWNTTTSIKDLNDNVTNYNWCGIRADLEYPVVYYNSKTCVDYGSLVLIEKFANLSYMDRVSPTEEATDFMLRFIIETEKINVKAKKNQLYLLERRPFTRAIPNYINTDLIADLWGEFYYGECGGKLAMDNWNKPPTLEDVLYKSGLDWIEEPLVIKEQSVIPEVDYIRITAITAFFYIAETNVKKFEERKKIVETFLEMSELKPVEYEIIQADTTAIELLKKENTNVSV